MKRPVSILAAMFQGGGNIPLLTPILARLVERGHELRIIIGPGVRRSRLPAAHPTDRPSVDDLALAGGQQHEAGLRTSRGCGARHAIVINDRRQNHPGGNLATADQRPATGQSEATVDDMRLAQGLRIVGRDDLRIVMNGMRRLWGELSCGPVRIAIPYAPRDRRVGFRELLEHGDAVHWCQVEPAIGRR